jgi:hypothetical protein
VPRRTKVSCHAMLAWIPGSLNRLTTTAAIGFRVSRHIDRRERSKQGSYVGTQASTLITMASSPNQHARRNDVPLHRNSGPEPLRSMADARTTSLPNTREKPNRSLSEALFGHASFNHATTVNSDRRDSRQVERNQG